MQFFKHYSFDLWLTLIKSNPSFKIERAKYFHAHYNPLGKSIEEVASIFRNVDLMVNGINEKSGLNIDAEEMYLMVISTLNNYSPDFSRVNIKELYLTMEALVLEHMPEMYCTESLGVLFKLKENGKSTISLLSNTGFIKGVTLRKILQHLKIDQVLDFQLYSDEVRMSKPNPKFFQLMIDNIDRKRHRSIAHHEIIHIGDNPIADSKGANALGINSLLINSNHLKINYLLS
ncbi:MAG: HAD family hydrolase [Pedobacter sp.]|nr:MAG: HAD family hydrolase [Pedobacter sp.]